MFLISEEYRQLNARMHVERRDFGHIGCLWQNVIREILDTYECKTILDYGCGKGTLAEVFGSQFTIRSYDPAIPGKDVLPSPADLVVCTDVMEHVEPECVQNVIRHLRQLTKKILFVSISLVPAGKNFPDGRNAHICVHLRLVDQPVLCAFDIERVICHIIILLRGCGLEWSRLTKSRHFRSWTKAAGSIMFGPTSQKSPNGLPSLRSTTYPRR